jgi:hypothetical protein
MGVEPCKLQNLCSYSILKMYMALSLTDSNPLQANIRKLILNVNKKFRHVNCLTLDVIGGVQKKELADSLAPINSC